MRDRIVAVARENPDFGVTRVANHLLRFENVRVSAGSVRVILREAERERKRLAEDQAKHSRGSSGQTDSTDTTDHRGKES